MGTLLSTIRKPESGASDARRRTIAVHVRTGNGLLASERKSARVFQESEASELIAAAWQ